MVHTHLSKIFLGFSLLFFSSCASILNGTYQKVYVNSDDSQEILVDGETPEMKNGRYLLKRDAKFKQITLTKEGYKDEHFVVAQHKRSPLYILSVVPFGILFYPIFYDLGPKAWNYSNEITPVSEMVTLPERDEKAKQLRLNQVSVDIDAEAIKTRYFYNYGSFLRKEERKQARNQLDSESIQIENTIFSDLLNEMLAEKGYIDTTRKIFKNSFSDNLYINATITDFTLHIVGNAVRSFGANSMSYVDLGIKWEALDYYKNPIASFETQTTSGQFANNTRDQALQNPVKDAMEYGLIEFVNSPKMQELMLDDGQAAIEAAFEEIPIVSTGAYVSNLTQAIQASVTVKTDDGHGSGFFVSSNGFLVTNYHVVLGAETPTILLNNGTELEAGIIRVSKIHDLALLKVDVSDITPFQLSDKREFEIAQEVYAVGTPTAEDLSQTVSKGIISGIRKKGDGSKLIQTDASLNPGNSGGAIVTKEGLVLGVVSAKLQGFGVEGVAFGIPAYQVIDVLKVKPMN